ncbi:hypothetical protein GCM10007916_24820 [Psychromonas marina]|uniref:Uncharacterized protein n=1 Tax=Psychromonas marina TaxID=88364 RepID=A0ABQ6E1Y3_9GAMM|nr:hypothetical protein [Psychromonas marina]GLS91413.1 hypothetical protein GCM10007916_24820 [Psychromonas marina]
MSKSVEASSITTSAALLQLTKPYDAMQLAQLCAFAFAIPQLYLCREYLSSDEDVAIKACLTRLEKGLQADTFNIETLNTLLVEKEFYDSEEARLRLAPEPDCLETL